MRTSQAKRVCVYGWGGAREWYYWWGGQKSFHVVCTVCVCVCVCVREREREREREKKPQRATNTKPFVEKESSHFFQQAAFSSFPCLKASAGILAAIFYFPYPDPFSLWLASRTFVESKPTILKEHLVLKPTEEGLEVFCPGAQLGSLPGTLGVRPERTWKYEAAYTQEVCKTEGTKSPWKTNPVFLSHCVEKF